MIFRRPEMVAEFEQATRGWGIGGRCVGVMRISGRRRSTVCLEGYYEGDLGEISLMSRRFCVEGRRSWQQTVEFIVRLLGISPRPGRVTAFIRARGVAFRGSSAASRDLARSASSFQPCLSIETSVCGRVLP
jgi:hypothetical protein